MPMLDSLPVTAPDAAFALIERYKADHSSLKVDLSPGFYRDEDAKPWILPSVQQAKQSLQDDQTQNHEHFPLAGLPELLDGARELIFGRSAAETTDIASIQTIAGTGANHLGALLLAKACRPQTIWISNPSWINHTEIWHTIDASITRRFYPYFDADFFRIDFDAMLSTLDAEASQGDVIILHGCAHNPTGLDLSREQWTQIASLCERKRLVPLFDVAYQGFATGDLEGDAWPIRHFYCATSLEILVAQSFSKNFGLYGERVGVLHVVCRMESAKDKTLGMLVRLSRAEITSCPINGAKIISKILNDRGMKRQWQSDLLHMSGRMASMRRRLVDRLHQLKTPGSWDHILTDIGMFSMTGLQPGQVTALREQHHVYLLPSGRISVTGRSYHLSYPSTIPSSRALTKN